MNNHVNNKKIFSEAEKDTIIEEILEEKPWEGLFKGKVALFLRKRTLTLYCLITALTMFGISQDISQPHIGWAGFVIAAMGFLWDTFITSRSYDLHMTEREWVTLAVKGGYLGDKDLIENKNFFTRNLFLWIPMLCLTGVITYCLYFLNINTNDIWYLCITFLLYPMFYATIHYNMKLKEEHTVLEGGLGYFTDNPRGFMNIFVYFDKTYLLWLIPILSFIVSSFSVLIVIISISDSSKVPMPLPVLGIFLFLSLAGHFSFTRAKFLSFKLGALSNYIKLIYIHKGL